MRIVEIRERTVPISRYLDATIPSGGLNTSIVAVITDVWREGKQVVGFGFSSMGRFGQGGLIRDRFAPRLISSPEETLLSETTGNLDPVGAWQRMMDGEKPGGHGERCVAVGTLDMALWDAAAKIAGQPLWFFLTNHPLLSSDTTPPLSSVPVYASGGYPFPSNELERLTDEVRRFLGLGYTHLKIKIGAQPLTKDLERIEAVLALLPNGTHLAVDAMNRYDLKTALEAAAALQPYGLMWFEDVCDPLDFRAQSEVASHYAPPIAAGEALFSLADARNLIRYGGLRPDQDVLVFDPVHCYGVPEYLNIITMLETNGWSRATCKPHGGHLFALHLAAALRLGGIESNPHSFQPFGGFADDTVIENGVVRPPEVPGIGFETRATLRELFYSLL